MLPQWPSRAIRWWFTTEWLPSMLRSDKIGDNYSNFRPLLVFHASSLQSSSDCVCVRFSPFSLTPKVTCVENPRNEKAGTEEKKGTKASFMAFCCFIYPVYRFFLFLPLAYRPSTLIRTSIKLLKEEGWDEDEDGVTITELLCVFVQALNTGKWNLQ